MLCFSHPDNHCRLDKPVSGLLLFARSPVAANALRQRIEGGEVEKVYVARVQGRVSGGRGEAGRGGAL